LEPRRSSRRARLTFDAPGSTLGHLGGSRTHDQKRRMDTSVLTCQPSGSNLGPFEGCFPMRWILLLPPTIAASLLLCGVVALTYMILLSPPVADSGPLRLSEDVTHICFGFTASYCDETVPLIGASFSPTSFPDTGPWKPCGAHIISSPPKAVLFVPHQRRPCMLEDLPDPTLDPPLSPFPKPFTISKRPAPVLPAF
jgi:hypothetical protein